MDGDLCPLPELVAIAETFSCMLLIDEAHATGVFGANGAGCAEHFGCSGHPLIQVGTLSKALGSLGGYIAGSAPLIDYLRNRAPTWIYTTGLTPPDTAAALAAIKIVQQEPQHRDQLWQNVESLKHLLAQQTPDCNRSDGSERNSAITHYQSPIFCLPLKDATTALEVAHQLKRQGIFAPAIRPPTAKTSRLRVSLMATHGTAHLQQLVNALRTIDENLLRKS